ncbi:DUF3572 family protein [Pedomonas sp. V897]|uniref:DUF3572 family protein n=1 Tax=Pedomonas sp. V897 TaxID=3446482 RepID=UPI003EDF048A
MTVEKIDAAEVVALRCIIEIAGDPDLGPRFLALTGLDADGLRASLTEHGTLAAALGFLLDHEPSLILVAQRAGIAPQEIAEAAATLGAGPVAG